MNSADLNFSDWNVVAATGASALWVSALLILLGYAARLRMLGSDKDRYDFVNRHEVGVLWIVALILIVGGCLFGNSAILDFAVVWLVIRGLLTVVLGIVVALVIRHILRFHYPFYMEKRLRRYRYRPRVSPTGVPMRLLTEQEEDAYLDEGMLAEENIFSLDYDVWKDEETGFVTVEKYAGYLHAQQCPACTCQTMKISKEVILKQPVNREDGLLEKHYLCSYCRHSMRKTVRLRFSDNIHETGSSR